MMKYLLVVICLIFVTACDDESSSERTFPPSQGGGSQSGNVDIKMPPTPALNLAGLKSLPRTLTMTLLLENGQPQGVAPTRVTLLNSNFSEAQPTAFLPKERADFLFEMRDAGDEVLFVGGIRNPLKVVSERATGTGVQPAPTELTRTTIQLRLPVRAGAEKLVVTRLTPVKKQISVIDLVPLMRRATGR